MKKVHLVANAHLDPIWQWELDEGLAAALSTFRSAANLCEAYDFVFCHNESMLYEWIERSDPALFERIRALQAKGRWKVMGGWYLQPDCQMPSGESFVRQIAQGRKYFSEKFGAEPKVAVNLDSFGHSRGLVQILAKSGFEGYLHCRPGCGELPLESNEYVWEGYDGSRVKCVRSPFGYNTLLGQAVKKIGEEIDRNPDKDEMLVLWGVGNHGGGPSRADLEAIAALAENSEFEIVHTDPDAYFAGLGDDLPVVRRSLAPCMPGCYVSQIRVKQAHRKLENELYSTEKLCALAASEGRMDYPATALGSAERDLLLGEFHDVLPGSSVKVSEDYALELFGHGVIEAKRAKVEAFVKLSEGFAPTPAGEYTVMVWNPQPRPLTCAVECEFMLADQNHSAIFKNIRVFDEAGRELPSQLVKEDSNVPLDWRKRVCFLATLAPCSLNRFACREQDLPAKPKVGRPVTSFDFDNGSLRVRIDERGRIALVEHEGVRCVGDAMKLAVYSDNADPWGMRGEQLIRLGEKVGEFTLMSASESEAASGTMCPIAPLRVVEEGAVMTVVESMMKYGESEACVQYKFYPALDWFDVTVKLFNREKSRLLKWEIPVAEGEYLGDTAFGCEPLTAGGSENVSQRWVANCRGTESVCVLNDGVYASSCADGNLAVTLLRAPAYTAHPLEERRIISDERFVARIDQGEREFNLRFVFGEPDTAKLTAAAAAFNEKPYALSLSVGESDRPRSRGGISLSNPDVMMSAMKFGDSPKSEGLLVRLHNNAAHAAETSVNLGGEALGTLRFSGFEVKTLRIAAGRMTACDRMEV